MSEFCDSALLYAQENRGRFLEDLKELIRIPSISTDPSARGEMLRAADWVAAQLKRVGIEQVQIFQTPGHPVVFGENLSAGPDKPVVLIYGHYDVQPVEPLELWHTPPFEPTQVGENLYGRGASDMKGQVLTCLKAVESLSQPAAWR